MSKKCAPAIMGSLLLLSALPLTGVKAVLALAPSFPDLGDVVGPEGPLFQGQVVTLSLDGTAEDYSWSVTGDASITEEGVLTVGDTDGWILVTATSDEDPSYKSQALYEVHTPSAVELQDLVYLWATGANYTVELKGAFLDDVGKVLTLADLLAFTDYPTDVQIAYEDLVTKGNLAKYTEEAYYIQYGATADGLVYEGGSYNSPDGIVYDYDMVNGAPVKGAPDYYSYYTGIGDYKELYTNDLRYMTEDEFKIEDSNLELSEEGTLLYDAKKDGNDIASDSSYGNDYSFPMCVLDTVEGFYAGQFLESGVYLSSYGEISYDEEGMVLEIVFPDVWVTYDLSVDYRATMTVKDIGTTEIPGIDDLIAADEALLS